MSLVKSGALVTDLQRLDSRLTAASHRLREANDELHRAEVEHRQASEAVEAELSRLKAEPVICDNCGKALRDHVKPLMTCFQPDRSADGA